MESQPFNGSEATMCACDADCPPIWQMFAKVSSLFGHQPAMDINKRPFYFLQVEQLRSFDGDKNKLGNAEKFFMELLNLPKYVILHKNLRFSIGVLPI